MVIPCKNFLLGALTYGLGAECSLPTWLGLGKPLSGGASGLRADGCVPLWAALLTRPQVAMEAISLLLFALC